MEHLPCLLFRNQAALQTRIKQSSQNIYTDQGRKIFIALSREDVEEILAACNNLKHYTLLLTAYSAGLLSEVVKLQPVHIKRSRR